MGPSVGPRWSDRRHRPSDPLRSCDALVLVTGATIALSRRITRSCESNESHAQQLESTMQHGRARDATYPPDGALRIDLHHSRTFLGHRFIFFLLLS
ncbi:hypothetical protein WOLCODRAFT_139698, partial [Wolfiporia cocos MD-104 SS10]